MNGALGSTTSMHRDSMLFEPSADHLPHMVLEEEVRTMLFVSALYEADREHMDAFSAELEDYLFDPANDLAIDYDREVFGAYPRTSLQDAARALLGRVRDLARDVSRLRLLLIGQGIGGLVAAEAVRMFYTYFDSAAGAGTGGAAAWTSRVTFDGVLAINTPFFLFPNGLWSSFENAAIMAYTGQLALPHKPEDASARRKLATSAPVKFLSRNVLGGLTKVAMGVAAGVADMAGLDSSWHERHKFLDPIMSEKFDARVSRLTELMARNIPVVSIATRIKGAHPETYVYVPPKQYLPEQLHGMFEYVDVKAGKALEVAESALDKSKQPDAYKGLIPACAKVMDKHARERVNLA
ncbi:hypothetical protein H9P43_004061 [Blastocladiella emersonii ATCC 22665]|nr:hypothetical protein H9P43_004061 [Blastocladiella emersonii ATCC 22665]